jgi:DNA-binding protein HU-beta
MNRAALVDVVAVKAGVTKAAAVLILNEALATIINVVADGDVVRLSVFGTFAPRDRAPRAARNPRAGTELRLDAATVLSFRPSAAFEEAVG